SQRLTTSPSLPPISETMLLSEYVYPSPTFPPPWTSARMRVVESHDNVPSASDLSVGMVYEIPRTSSMAHCGALGEIAEAGAFASTFISIPRARQAENRSARLHGAAKHECPGNNPHRCAHRASAQPTGVV